MYNKTTEEVLRLKNSSSNGLTSAEAKNRLADTGANEVKLVKNLSLKNKIKAQLNSVVMYVLIFACIISAVATIIYKNTFLLVNVVLIFVAMILNVVIGVVSLSRVEKTLLTVDNKLKPYTTVKRDGKLIKVRTSTLVEGDIIYVTEGDIVPADVRIIRENNLYVCDLLITGETTAIKKTDAIINGNNLPLGEQDNMAFLGSNVTKGSAYCVVVATGLNTEIGKTTGLLNDEISIKTPLIEKLEKTVSIASCIVLALSLIGFVVNYLRGASNADCFMVIVNFAVCVVPEGLLIGIYTNLNRTITKLYHKNLYVKNLTTMEELGGVDIICIDKLGVVTESKMHVTDVWINNRDDYQVGRNPNFISLCNAMLLCNNAELVYDKDSITAVGSPYEVALLNYGLYLGYNKDKLEGICPRVNEFYYDRDRKVMSTINTVGEKSVVFVRGDFLRVLSKCDTILNEGVPTKLTDEKKQHLVHEYQKFIDDGNLVMAFATKEYRGDVYTASTTDVESALTFIGLTAVTPRLKDNVKESIVRLQKSGVKVILTTSDDSEITYATALDLGLVKNRAQLLTGDDLSKMTDTALKVVVGKYTVFAGLVPDQKLRVIKALKQSGKCVCTTGDKVTDINAMDLADISVGLGVQASEVVKQKAEVVLMDNDLNNLVEGIVESRRINKNILKSVQYAFSATIAQIVTLFTILVVMGKTLFSPSLLLWLNFFNGLLPCLGLGEEKSFASIYNPKRDRLFNGTTLFNIIAYGVLQSLIVLAVYFTSTYYFEFDHIKTITLCFVTIEFLEIFHSYNIKHEINSMFTTNPFNNLRLNINTLICTFISFVFVCLPLDDLRSSLGVSKLLPLEWLSCVGIALIIIPLVEIIKMFVRTYLESRRKKR